MTEKEQEQSVYTYRDLVRKLYDLEALAVPSQAGEKSGCFSSFDRRSVYNTETGLYEDWGANDDGGGFIRKEGESILTTETHLFRQPVCGR